MGRHSKAAKKKIHGISQARTYRSTSGTPAGPPSNAGEVNGQEEPTPSIVSDRILRGSMMGLLVMKMRSCQSWKVKTCVRV
jgi:hypothetical protein